VVDAKLRCDPHLPQGIENLRLGGIGLRGKHVDMD
jgi:hypothetical protein